MRARLLTTLLVACSTSAAQPPPAATQTVTLADVGLESASLDRTADPCVDFYQYACGGWLAKTKIPDDKARFARFTEIEEKDKVVLRGILEDAAKSGGKLGDFYASCMDDKAIEAAGTKPIGARLDKAQHIKDAKTWLAYLVDEHLIGSRLVWSEGATADAKDSASNITVVGEGSLGLPDRDYYFDDKYKDKLAAYHDHVGRILALAGNKATEADDVLAIETEMARSMKTAVERRDVQARYNPTDAKGLAKQVTSVDWPAYWKALNVTPSKRINISSPKYVAQIDKLRSKFKPAQWSSYFTYHLVRGSTLALPKAFDDEAFALQKLLTGQEKQEERYKRCVNATTGALGELLGQAYVAKAFPASAKQTAAALVDAIVAAMGEEIASRDWMAAPTRKTAADKLAKIVRMVGYPDTWRTYDFDVKRDDFVGNAIRAGAFEKHRTLSRGGKPVDRGEWQMNAFTVNAYYESSANNTALPAGILQAPFFGEKRSIAVNLGGIGMVIGHELTHGFDDQGSQYDAVGNLTNWWAKEDKPEFDKKAACVADMYGTFEALPKQYVNGKLTLGEDIADLGGVTVAFRAYKTLRASAAKPQVAEGFSEDQQFFLAVGQAWCSKDRPDEIQRRLAVDPHAPPKFRVYGALRNMREFADAFHCVEGTPMRPANVCRVW